MDQTDYENSEKYETYYVGSPPVLWYHRKAFEYLSRMQPQGKILDFGCFDGFFTAFLMKANLDAYGCDWNRKAIEYGRKEYGLGSRLSQSPKGVYDAIIALEVIEHFPDPNDFLDAVLPHLSADGVLVLSCPNKNSVYRPRTDFPPHHFSRFSQKSLASLLARRGLTVEIQEREMSCFQLLRNFLGDALRRDAETLKGYRETSVSIDTIHRLKQIANKAAGLVGPAFRPVDIMAHALGVSYLAQFVVARRGQEFVSDGKAHATPSLQN